MRHSCKLISILVGLIALTCPSVVMAQPPMLVLSIDGLAFTPTESSLTYSSMFSNCLIPSAIGAFRYPINTLPNGSTVKYIELIYKDSNAAAGSSLTFNEKTLTESSISSYAKINITENVNINKYQFLKSDEYSIVLDYSQHFYYLDWHASATSGLSLCGARVYYLPPSSATYLPVLKKE